MLTRVRFVLFVLTLALTPSLNAQSSDAKQKTAVAGPRLDATVTAVRRLQPPADSAGTIQQRPRRQNTQKAVTLMVVGGAAIVLGAVIGDAPGTLFMVGGAAAVLIGLYHYLQ